MRTSKPLPSAGDAFADVAAPLRPEVTGDVVSTAKNVAAASGEEDAVAYRNLARGNRRASRGRTRTRRCSPRARSKPVSGWDGNNTAVSVGLTFDFVIRPVAPATGFTNDSPPRWPMALKWYGPPNNNQLKG